MDVLGPVMVASTRVVKVVSMIGAYVTGPLLALSAIGLMAGGLDPASAGIGFDSPLLHASALGFAASLAGWHFADWADGKLHVNHTKAAQERELARLQSTQQASI